MNLLGRAILIAKQAHEGQFDKSGVIFMPLFILFLLFPGIFIINHARTQSNNQALFFLWIGQAVILTIFVVIILKG